MKAPLNEQIWFAVYKKNGDGTSRVVALFERVEAARGYSEHPQLYTVVNRKVRLTPAPITIEAPAPIYSDLAFQYCLRMANPDFPDSEIANFFDELNSFVAKYQEAASSPNVGDVPRAGNGAAPKEKNNL